MLFVFCFLSVYENSLESDLKGDTSGDLEALLVALSKVLTYVCFADFVSWNTIRIDIREKRGRGVLAWRLIGERGFYKTGTHQKESGINREHDGNFTECALLTFLAQQKSKKSYLTNTFWSICHIFLYHLLYDCSLSNLCMLFR